MTDTPRSCRMCGGDVEVRRVSLARRPGELSDATALQRICQNASCRSNGWKNLPDGQVV